MLLLPRSQVLPSGGLFATTSAARLPPAPGRFSTTTGWPSVSESFAPRARARMSLGPPGVKPTTKRTFCAIAGQAASSRHSRRARVAVLISPMVIPLTLGRAPAERLARQSTREDEMLKRSVVTLVAACIAFGAQAQT